MKDKQTLSAVQEFDVGCAVIKKQKQILIAQRNPGDSMGGFWEFPGGKREHPETIEDCLIREAYEELGIQVRPERLIATQKVRRPTKIIQLHFYICRWISGEPYKGDCHDFRWVDVSELRRFLFLPADIDMINELTRRRAYYFL